MMPLIIILIPIIASILVYFLGRSLVIATRILISAAVLHCIGCVFMLVCGDDILAAEGLSKWLMDGETSWILLVTSMVFLAVAIHTALWIPVDRAQREQTGHTAGMKDKTFISCMLLFLGTMSIVLMAQNLGLLWAAVEATTLTSAPLIMYHRSAESIEAMWKYLLICSVGIGLALMGTMMVGVSTGEGESCSMNLADLASRTLHPGWFKAAFIFILAGYGTKMGLAPFHSWLPDAHSEAPGCGSALLSAALLNCSFVGIMRFVSIAPESVLPFCQHLMIFLGFVSIALAVFFIIHQADFKRMLAYSSVEHMGIIAIMGGLGLEQVVEYHCFGHSFIKMALFLLAGNILLAYGTRRASEIGGMFHQMPKTAMAWIIGILLICGMPPSPLFISEFLLICRLPGSLGLLLAVLLFAVFAGMTQIALKMCMGQAERIPAEIQRSEVERIFKVPAIVIGVVVIFGCLLICNILGAA